MNQIFLLVLIFSACFEDDEKVLPYPGEVVTIDHNIGEYQSYFDLETKRVVAFNHINEWDMAFGSKPGSWRLRINSAKELFVFKSELNSVEEDYNISDYEIWKYDKPDGNPDSSAFGKWCDTAVFPFLSGGNVYIIGRKKSQGYAVYAKIQMVSCDSDRYVMRYQKADKRDVYLVEINKSDSVNFVYYDFENDLQKNLEPGFTTYDLIFTPYYDLVYGIIETPMPYFVRGVMLNSSKVMALLETSKTFDEITGYQIENENFSPLQDIIGWDWKDVTIDFSGETASYNVLTNRTYIIKSFEGNYFKLRFLSYKLDGIYGFPRFEFKPLIPAE